VTWVHVESALLPRIRTIAAVIVVVLAASLLRGGVAGLTG
jgi:hypothetical protein